MVRSPDAACTNSSREDTHKHLFPPEKTPMTHQSMIPLKYSLAITLGLLTEHRLLALYRGYFQDHGIPKQLCLHQVQAHHLMESNGNCIVEVPFQSPSTSYIIQHLPRSFAAGEWQEGVMAGVSGVVLRLPAPFNYGETYLPLHCCV